MSIETLPILPLRNSVVFPASVVPINVGRARSVRLVEDLLGQERAVVGIVSQRDADVDEPGFEDIYDVGTVARVVKVIRLGAANYSVVLHGLSRLQLAGKVGLEPYMRAQVGASPRISSATPSSTRSARSSATSMRELLALMPNLPKETTGDPRQRARERRARRSHRVEPHARAGVTVADKQKVLETFDAKARVRARPRRWCRSSSSSSA